MRAPTGPALGAGTERGKLPLAHPPGPTTRKASMQRLLTLLLLSGTVAFAQPSATIQPDLLVSVDVTSSFSSREDIARGSTVLGTLAVDQFGFSASARQSWSQQTTLVYGVAVNSHDFKASVSTLPIPDDLTELSLNLGLQHRHNERWSSAVFLRPGFYGDLDDGLDADALNAPLLALANYAQSRDLIWSFGLNVNPFSDNSVLPIVGVRWQFAPDWLFSVGFPRTGVTWKATDRLSLRTSVAFSGGSFRLTRNLGSPAAGIPRLANTFVDFREVRVGLGADYALTDRTTLSLDAGAVTDRKLDYFNKGYRLDGDGGTFVSLAIKGAF